MTLRTAQRVFIKEAWGERYRVSTLRAAIKKLDQRRPVPPWPDAAKYPVVKYCWTVVL